MSNKKPDKKLQVIVQGKITGMIDPDGTEHQTYRYHVNIHEQNTKQDHVYDREIHIFKSVPSNTDEVEAANKQQYISNEQPPQADNNTNNEPAVVNRENKPQKHIKPALLKLKERLSFKLSIPRIKLPHLNIKRPSIKLPAIKLPGLNIKPGKIKNPVTSNKIKIRPSKALSEKFTQRNIIRFCLPCILLTVTAIIIYFLYEFVPAREKIVYPITKPDKKRVEQTQKDYRAVVEKTRTGVVITLQGPDHEEILTKLPPGYDPVVEGNKIVHVVTPGNTLWFIAMRYIKNPYRYPELARLNNIKNPDLIFPGEKVVIQYIRKP